jgi:hypothetical protein
MASGYSALLTSVILLRTFYPRFWLGEVNLRQIASPELESFRSRLRIFYPLTAAGPLLLGAFAFLAPEEVTIPVGYLSAILLVSTLGGILFDTAVSHQVARVLYAYSSRKPRALL